MTLINEVGNGKTVTSLGGVESPQGKGRSSNSYQVISPGGNGVIFLASGNPKRIALVVQNQDTALTVGIMIGDNTGFTLLLLPLGSIQFDVNFPWIGDLWLTSVAVGTPVVTVVEIATV